MPTSGSFVRHHHGEDEELQSDIKAEQLSLCNYRGTVGGVAGSWAAISTCDGFSGLIFDGNEYYSIEPHENDEHWLIKHSGIYAIFYK